MPPSNKTIRSLKTIRNHSETPGLGIVPYKAYVVVTTLEMERFRREAERAKLLTRFEFINSRLQSIAAEKAEILRRMGQCPSPQPIEKRRLILSAAPVSTRAGFRMKY